MRSGKKICGWSALCAPGWSRICLNNPPALLAPQSSYTNLPEPKEGMTATGHDVTWVKGYPGIWRHVLFMCFWCQGYMIYPWCNWTWTGLGMMQQKMKNEEVLLQSWVHWWRGDTFKTQTSTEINMKQWINMNMMRVIGYWNNYDAFCWNPTWDFAPPVLNGQITFAGILVGLRVLRAKLSGWLPIEVECTAVIAGTSPMLFA